MQSVPLEDGGDEGIFQTLWWGKKVSSLSVRNNA